LLRMNLRALGLGVSWMERTWRGMMCFLTVWVALLRWSLDLPSGWVERLGRAGGIVSLFV
jgi:hypothetical protein